MNNKHLQHFAKQVTCLWFCGFRFLNQLLSFSKCNTDSYFLSQHSVWSPMESLSHPANSPTSPEIQHSGWQKDGHTLRSLISGTAWPSTWLLSISRKGHSCVVIAPRRGERQNMQRQIVMAKHEQQMAIMFSKLWRSTVEIILKGWNWCLELLPLPISKTPKYNSTIYSTLTVAKV